MQRNTIFYFLIFLVGFSIYFNSLDNPFIWDDNILVAHNPYLKELKSIFRAFTTEISFGRQHTSSYRPLVNVSFILDYSLWKLKPFGYHLTNTLLHILNSLFVFYLLSSSLGQNRQLSFLVSLLFLVHPVQTNVITYISGRADALATLFLLLALILYLKFLKAQKIVFFPLSLFLYLLALSSKEIALCFPFIVLLYEFTFLSPEEKRALRPKRAHYYAWLLFISFSYLIIRYAVLKSLIGFSSSFYPPFLKRMLPMPSVFCRYLRLLFLPYGLSLSHQVHLPHSLFEPKTLTQLSFWMIFLIFSLRSIRYSRLIFFGLLWFLIHLLAISNIIPLNAYMAESWLYLPSIGFFIVLIGMGFRLGKRPLVLILCLTMIIFYACLTIRRNLDYQDPIKFYQKTLKYCSSNYRVHHNLGMSYLDKGEDELAFKSFENALHCKPDLASSFVGLGFIYQKRKEFNKAERSYQEALRIKPDLKEAQILLESLRQK